MKVLVTGANGQLGSEIKAISPEYSELTFDFQDIDTLNLLDQEELKIYFENNTPDFVVNCAAYTAVDKAESEKEESYKGNCVIVTNLVNECIKYNSKLIHISTDYVFDGTNFRPYNEDDPVKPQSEYGMSKLYGEQEALKYDKSIIIRTSWLYSSFGNNFVKNMIRLGKEKKELNVVFDQVGNPTYAKDLALAILHIISGYKIENSEFIPGIFHFSNEGVCSWYDFAQEIMLLSGINCKVIPIESKEFPTPAKRPFYSVLNKKKIKDSFNLTIPHWKESLKKCLDIIEK